jgi:LacI family transcriptional regulator
MFEPITIKDIAKALGLSTSTVSRALRGGYEISAETKKLVLAYAEKINYHPNPIALSLKERRSHSIGVVVCEVANNYFSQAINGIESIAYSRGYHVIITQTHESAEREVVNVQHLASRSVDGLLISLSSETQDYSHLQYLHDKGLPIVFFDRVAPDIKTHKVTANNYKGAFEATEHLIKAGFRKIGHLTSSPQLSISIERLEGYKAALAKHNIPFNPDYLHHCEHGGMIQDEVEVAVTRLIGLADRPESIFIAGDRLSTGCLISLKKHGLKVPGDISVAGFTNSDFAELFSPALTTVRQPAFKIGQIATEMLIQLIESKYPVTEFETKMLDTELFIRESSEYGVSVEG